MRNGRHMRIVSRRIFAEEVFCVLEVGCFVHRLIRKVDSSIKNCENLL